MIVDLTKSYKGTFPMQHLISRTSLVSSFRVSRIYNADKLHRFLVAAPNARGWGAGIFQSQQLEAASSPPSLNDQPLFSSKRDRLELPVPTEVWKSLKTGYLATRVSSLSSQSPSHWRIGVFEPQYRRRRSYPVLPDPNRYGGTRSSLRAVLRCGSRSPTRELPSSLSRVPTGRAS
jgi:hypothetical protein